MAGVTHIVSNYILKILPKSPVGQRAQLSSNILTLVISASFFGALTPTPLNQLTRTKLESL
ncbi:hypothetical protein AXFE_31040 [Acidithrix ferrooxidans]|uniref:Uncharacterized protein n=1 Tax=Acidithrix ferrooxidans TaxID=1280514 RepID=A0A0D8HDJ6_9ACTN|nr:hypothetical protein AXFE_31040 [Acidithrix ferrooxidans]CAG4911118.1 unnamed protein product [Acidithrix sp. C25]